jgi:hypothetical protein
MEHLAPHRANDSMSNFCLPLGMGRMRPTLADYKISVFIKHEVQNQRDSCEMARDTNLLTTDGFDDKFHSAVGDFYKRVTEFGTYGPRKIEQELCSFREHPRNVLFLHNLDVRVRTPE